MATYLNVTAEPGTIARKWVPISDVPNAPTIPLILIAGVNPGPTLLVTAGLHGDEYDGLEAALRISEMIKPEELTGAIAVIPRINMRAYDQGRRWSNLDGLDLNRQFPGLQGGFMGQRLAWFLTNRALEGVDFVLDYHGGTSELEVVSYGAVVAKEPTRSQVTSLLGVAHIWDWAETVGMKGTFMDVCEARDIPFAIVEIGGGNRWSEGPVTDGVNAALNILRYLNMIEGDYVGVKEEQLVLRGTFLHAEADGFMRQKVGLGEWVEEGQVLAAVYDLLGNLLYEVRSDVTGVVNDIRTHPSVHCGEWMYMVGRIVDRRSIDAASLSRSR